MLSRSRSPRKRGFTAVAAATLAAASPFVVADGWGLIGSGAALGQQTAPAPPPSFARQPITPLETWDVVDYLIRTGQPEQAAPYVKQFLDANPDDATLLRIRDEYGPGTILRLADFPSTAPYSAPLLDRVSKAALRAATDPARLDRFVAGAPRIARGASLRGRPPQGGRPIRRGADPPRAVPPRPEQRGAGSLRREPRPARPDGRPSPDRRARQLRRQARRRRRAGPRADRRPPRRARADVPGREAEPRVGGPPAGRRRDRGDHRHPVRLAAQDPAPRPGRRGPPLPPPRGPLPEPGRWSSGSGTTRPRPPSPAPRRLSTPRGISASGPPRKPWRSTRAT